MKTLPGPIAAHYALGTTTFATALRITRASDAEVFGFTTHDVSDTVGSVPYLANPGLDLTDIRIAAGCDVGNMEVLLLHDQSVFTVADVLNGIWRNSAFLIFRYNHRGLTDGIDPLLAGNVGEVRIRENTVTVELLDLRQFLQQPVGTVSAKTCPWRLGSISRADGGLCRKDISAAPFTMPFEVTAVTSNQIFQDNARTEDEDWFGWGEVLWLTGNNAGVRRKIKAYAADGSFTLDQAMFLEVQVGDTGTAIAGCRQRRDEDCRDKFDNVLNFGGQPDRKGLDDLTKQPTVDVYAYAEIPIFS